MKAKGYITERDGLRYETLREVRLHVWALTEKDRESLNGCPVLKDSGKLAGYLRIRYTGNGAVIPVISRN